MNLKPNLRNLVVIVATFATLTLTSCGGSKSSTPPAATPTPTPTASLAGRIQKGPFAIGSQITVNELNDTLGPTGKVYNVQTSDDLGNFAVASKIGTHLVDVVGNGFFMDELSGQLASAPIQLQAIVDLSVNSSPTINVLTALQAPRLKALIAQGNAYAVADAQSRNEVLAAFGIDPLKVSGLTNLYSMKINGSTDPDAVLLAISSILSQMAHTAAASKGSSIPAELSSFVSTIANQLTSTGVLSNASILAARQAAAIQLDLAAVRSNVESFYASKSVTLVAPKFEEWVDKDGSGILPRRLVATTGLVFTDATGVGAQQIVTSNIVTVSGIGAGIFAPVTVDASTTLIKNNVAIVGSASTVQDGDTLALQITSLGYALTNTSTLQVGTSSAVWHVASKPLGGTIRMLNGSGLILSNNGTENIAIAAGSTTFNFVNSVANGATYSVVVATQPTAPAQVCSVSGGAGTVSGTPSNLIVSCAGPVTGLGFANQTGVNPGAVITSNDYTVTGLGAGIIANVTVDASTTLIKNTVDVVGSSTSVIDGDTLALRVTALGYGLTNTSTVTIASSSADWLVTSKPLGGTITGLVGSGLMLGNNADVITVAAGAPTFNLNAPVPMGSSYNARVLTHPASPLQLCSFAPNQCASPAGELNTVSCGVASATPSNISASCSSQSALVYGTNGALIYVDASTGALHQDSSTGVYLNSMTTDSTRSFAYLATNPISGQFIDSYTVDVRGRLTHTGASVSGANFMFDGTGKFGLASTHNMMSGTNTFTSYALDTLTGAMTSTGSSLTSSNLMWHPSRQFVYAYTPPATPGDGTWTAYKINTITGIFEANAITVVGNAWGFVFDPAGTAAFISSAAGITSYGINATTGALSVGTTVAGTSVTIDPLGKFAYVNVWNTTPPGSWSTTSYTIGTLGILVNPVTVTTSGSVLKFDPLGKFAYDLGWVGAPSTKTLTTYLINTVTGALIQQASVPTTLSNLTFDPTGKYAFDTSTKIDAFSINQTTGGLTPIGVAVPGQGITFDPSGLGKFAYVYAPSPSMIGDGSLQACTVTATGLVKVGTPVTIGYQAPQFDPSGKFLLGTATGGLTSYSIDPTTGGLTPNGATIASVMNISKVIPAP